MANLAGRRKPYTAAGIGRLKCVFCGERAHATWQVCADDRLHRPLCTLCDAAINAIALCAMANDPDRAEKMVRYASKEGAPEPGLILDRVRLLTHRAEEVLLDLHFRQLMEPAT